MSAHSGGPWAREGAEALLKKLNVDGLSSSQIAARIYDDLGITVTRNSVIGRLHRLGLKGTGTETTRVNTRAINGARSRAQTEPRFECEPLPADDDLQLEGGCTMLELTNATCRWPYGEPGSATFRFCGKTEADLIGGFAYCAGHTRTARP